MASVRLRAAGTGSERRAAPPAGGASELGGWGLCWSAGGADQAGVEQPQPQTGGDGRNRCSVAEMVTTAEPGGGEQRKRLRRGADGEQVTSRGEGLAWRRRGVTGEPQPALFTLGGGWWRGALASVGGFGGGDGGRAGFGKIRQRRTSPPAAGKPRAVLPLSLQGRLVQTGSRITPHAVRAKSRSRSVGAVFAEVDFELCATR